MIDIDFDRHKKENASIQCPSFTDDTTYELYIHDGRIRCSCKSFQLYHGKRGSYCKHIKLLAKTILES